MPESDHDFSGEPLYTTHTYMCVNTYNYVVAHIMLLVAVLMASPLFQFHWLGCVKVVLLIQYYPDTMHL